MKPKDPFEAAIEAAEKASLVRPQDLAPADAPALIEEWRAAWEAEDPAFRRDAVVSEIDPKFRQDVADLLVQRRARFEFGPTTRQEQAVAERRAAVDNLLLGKYLAPASPFFVLALRDRHERSLFGFCVRGLVQSRHPRGFDALLSCVFHPPFGFGNPGSFDSIPGWSVNPGVMSTFAASVFALGTVSDELAQRLASHLASVENQSVRHAIISIFVGLPDCDVAFDALCARFEDFPVETRHAAAKRTRPATLPLDRLRTLVKSSPISDQDLRFAIPRVNRVLCALELLVDAGDAEARPKLEKLRRRVDRHVELMRRGRERGEF